MRKGALIGEGERSKVYEKHPNVINTHGGAGRNQGRKLKYGEKTVKVNYRIPTSKKIEVDYWISKQLNKWQKENMPECAKKS